MGHVDVGAVGDGGIIIGVQAVAAGRPGDGVRADPGNAVAGDIGIGLGTAAGKGELGFE